MQEQRTGHTTGHRKLAGPALLFLALLPILTAQNKIIRNGPGIQAGDFLLAGNERVADILVDPEDSPTVHLAARLFAQDIGGVTGRRPRVGKGGKPSTPNRVIAGTIGRNRLITGLIEAGRIDVEEVENRWETCLIQVLQETGGKALVVAGSDRRGTAYGLLELSRQMGVSPWHDFADVPPKRKKRVHVSAGRFVQGPPSVKYRGIFINDEMWGLRPWASLTLAPREGKGIGPTTYRKIFELLLRLKANLCWPAMHRGTKPFNCYEENKVVADEFGIVMGSSHIEPMLRNNIGGAEWDREYPGEPWDYRVNRDHIYEYWEKAVKRNGKYENIYTLGKRGLDDEAGSDITVAMLERIFADQREILKRWVGPDVTRIPQVLIPYTEVLHLYNQGLRVPGDVTICWPDDNFGYIRQLPDRRERQRPGGSGVYYHFQWLNGATTAYTWLHTTPPTLTWLEMKKAYDHGARTHWVVNVGDIKPAEVGIDHFMQMAWDMAGFAENDPAAWLEKWAAREFGPTHASAISSIMMAHFELGYARRPEHMVMYNGRRKEHLFDWFSIENFNDEAGRRLVRYQKLQREVERVHASLPDALKAPFFQMVLYNVKGAALHNQKAIWAQKSHAYGRQGRASAALYAAKAKQAAEEIGELIRHYNTGQKIVGRKWNHMASLPGPWGAQWQQWAMPPLSDFSGAGPPRLQAAPEGGKAGNLPGFSVYNRDRRFVDLYNRGRGPIGWSSKVSHPWIGLSETSGSFREEKRIWVTIDWEKAPRGKGEEGTITFVHKAKGSDPIQVRLTLFHPPAPPVDRVRGFVESNGYIAMEGEHYSGKVDKGPCRWQVLEGLGRTGDSVYLSPMTAAWPSHPAGAIKAGSPALRYDIHTFSTGWVDVRLHCIPTHPVNRNHKTRVAVSLDDGVPVVISPRSRSVIDNLMVLAGRLKLSAPGRHALHIWAVDPGMAIDRILIDTGGMPDSYLGPPESKCYKSGA